MIAARLLALLLPLGIWLVQSTAAPHSNESRLAGGGFLAIGFSLIAFFAVGFGLMFGGVGAVNGDPALSQYVSFLTFPFANQSWGIVGLRGFGLLDASPAALDIFVSYVPLVATVSVLVSSVLVQRSGGLMQIAAASLISAIIFPVVGFWLWGGGWLAMLGVNMNLGHGAVDFGGITTAALAAGCAGFIWLFGNRNDGDVPSVTLQSYHPYRGLTGIIFMVIGVCAFFAGNPLFASISADSQSIFVVNALLSSFLAGGLAIGYSTLALRRPDMLLAGRAVFAALVMTAAGSVLYSTAIAVFTGVFGAIVAIAGAYYATTVWRLRDEYGFVLTSVLAGAIGLVFVGLFANGTRGMGLNTVGTTAYLGVNGLGVSGLFTNGFTSSDPGQLTAQIVASIIIAIYSTVVFAPFAFLAKRAKIHQYAADVSTIDEELQPVPVAPSLVSTFQPAPVAPSLAPSLQPVTAPVQVTASEVPTKTAIIEAPVAQVVAETQIAQPVKRITLLERLRLARMANKPTPPPAQARHTAYPVRAGGRRISIRPLVHPRQTAPAQESPEKNP